jgi:hypothetical protein
MNVNNDTPDTSNIVSPEWEERLLDFSFGAMSPDDSIEFERQLTEYSARVELAQQYRSTAAMLGSVVAPAEPPEGHKARFMAKLAATPQVRSGAAANSIAPARLEVVGATSPKVSQPTSEREHVAGNDQEERIIDLVAARTRRQSSLLAPVMAAAAAVIILVMGAWLWSVSSSLEAQKGKVAIPPGYKAFPIEAQAPYSSTAVVLFNPDTKDAYLLADRLEPLPEGKIYEFWFLPAETGANPQAAGIFTPGAGGAAKHSAMAPTNVGNYTGFAVTLEDAPGGDTPKGPPVLAGSFR